MLRTWGGMEKQEPIQSLLLVRPEGGPKGFVGNGGGEKFGVPEPGGCRTDFHFRRRPFELEGAFGGEKGGEFLPRRPQVQRLPLHSSARHRPALHPPINNDEPKRKEVKMIPPPFVNDYFPILFLIIEDIKHIFSAVNI